MSRSAWLKSTALETLRLTHQRRTENDPPHTKARPPMAARMSSTQGREDGNDPGSLFKATTLRMTDAATRLAVGSPVGIHDELLKRLLRVPVFEGEAVDDLERTDHLSEHLRHVRQAIAEPASGLAARDHDELFECYAYFFHRTLCSIPLLGTKQGEFPIAWQRLSADVRSILELAGGTHGSMLRAQWLQRHPQGFPHALPEGSPVAV